MNLKITETLKKDLHHQLSTYSELPFRLTLGSIAEYYAVSLTPVRQVIEELIEDGVNGVLVPVDDVDALADALGRIANDMTLARRLAEAGRARWHDILSPQRVTGDWMDFLAKVAG